MRNLWRSSPAPPRLAHLISSRDTFFQTRTLRRAYIHLHGLIQANSTLRSERAVLELLGSWENDQIE